jgi:hypothetical protein
VEGSDCRIIQGNKFSIFLKELRKSGKRLRIPEPRDLINIKWGYEPLDCNVQYRTFS